MTRISVVIPVRDRAELLDRCLSALVPQLADVEGEIIVVDDGSSDGSVATAERWAADAPVRVLHSDGAGAVAARSMGVDASESEVLAFTDSDCVPSPGWLSAGLAAIDAGAALAQGRTTPVRPCGMLERSIWVVREDGLFATCNLFVRRSIFDEVGGFDAAAGDRLHFRAGALAGLGFGEDTLFGWRVRRHGHPISFADDAHVGHEVFRFDTREHVRRSWQAGGFAGLVREVPELRETLLVDRIFLGSRRRGLLHLAVLLALVGARRPARLCWGLFLGVHVAQALRRERLLRRRAAAVAVGITGDVVTGTALLVGSARARSLVL